MVPLIIFLSVLSCFNGVRGFEGLKGVDTEALKNISVACGITRHSDLCREYVVSSGSVSEVAAEPIEFVKLAMQLALDGVETSLKLASEASSASGSPMMRLFLEDSVELLGHSQALLARSQSEDLQANESLSNVHHWLSAALTYNNDCHEFLRNYTSEIPQLTSFIENKGIPLLSNALTVAAALTTAGSNFSSWQPPSTAVGDNADISAKLFGPMGVCETYNNSLTLSMASAVVSKDARYGSHDTIQSAVDDAPTHLLPGQRHIIFITAGTYTERVRVPSNKTFLVFVGAGINRTVISGDLSVAKGMTTYRTATLAIEGAGFMARDLTVVNTAGPESQAVALRVDSDMSAFHRCSFWGYQDTLYTHAYRQFYRECQIYGTVDFIFGNAASVFQNCEILIRPSSPNRTTSAISAQGRTDPAQATAFVCQSCSVRGTPEYTSAFWEGRGSLVAFLGRPWKPFARSIFMQTFMDVIIDARGWLPWNTTTTVPQSELLANTTLAEFHSLGPGGNPLFRVPWSKQITPFAAIQFTVRQLIQGGYWLPFTGVPYRLAF